MPLPLLIPLAIQGAGILIRKVGVSIIKKVASNVITKVSKKVLGKAMSKSAKRSLRKKARRIDIDDLMSGSGSSGGNLQSREITKSVIHSAVNAGTGVKSATLMAPMNGSDDVQEEDENLLRKASTLLKATVSAEGSGSEDIKRFIEINSSILQALENIDKRINDAQDTEIRKTSEVDLNKDANVTNITNVFNYYSEAQDSGGFDPSAFALGAFMSGFGTLLPALWDVVCNEFPSIFGAMWDGVVEFVTQSWEEIKTTITQYWETFVSGIKGLWDGICTKTQAAWDSLSSFIKDAWSGYSETILESVNYVKEFASDMWNGISTKWDTFMSSAEGAWSSLYESITSAWNGITEFFKPYMETIKSIIDKVSNLIPNVSEIASKLGDSVLSTVSDAKEYLTNTSATQMLEDGVNFLKKTSIFGWFSGSDDEVEVANPEPTDISSKTDEAKGAIDIKKDTTITSGGILMTPDKPITSDGSVLKDDSTEAKPSKVKPKKLKKHEEPSTPKAPEQKDASSVISKFAKAQPVKETPKVEEKAPEPKKASASNIISKFAKAQPVKETTKVEKPVGVAQQRKEDAPKSNLNFDKDIMKAFDGVRGQYENSEAYRKAKSWGFGSDEQNRNAFRVIDAYLFDFYDTYVPDEEILGYVSDDAKRKWEKNYSSGNGKIDPSYDTIAFMDAYTFFDENIRGVLREALQSEIKSIDWKGKYDLDLGDFQGLSDYDLGFEESTSVGTRSVMPWEYEGGDEDEDEDEDEERVRMVSTLNMRLDNALSHEGTKLFKSTFKTAWSKYQKYLKYFDMYSVLINAENHDFDFDYDELFDTSSESSSVEASKPETEPQEIIENTEAKGVLKPEEKDSSVTLGLGPKQSVPDAKAASAISQSFGKFKPKSTADDAKNFMGDTTEPHEINENTVTIENKKIHVDPSMASSGVKFDNIKGFFKNLPEQTKTAELSYDGEAKTVNIRINGSQGDALPMGDGSVSYRVTTGNAASSKSVGQYFSSSKSLDLSDFSSASFSDYANAPAQVMAVSTDGINPKIAELAGSRESNGQISCISSGKTTGGKKDRGGVSYGAWQMTSEPDGGNITRFLHGKYGKQYLHYFEGKKLNSPEFKAAFKQACKDDPKGMFKAQFAFIKGENYDPAVAKVKKLGVDTNNFAIQSVLWSASVQHGPGHTRTIASRAMEALGYRDTSTPEKRFNFIKEFYKQRTLFWPDTASRYRAEMKDALKLINVKTVQGDSSLDTVVDAQSQKGSMDTALEQTSENVTMSSSSPSGGTDAASGGSSNGPSNLSTGADPEKEGIDSLDNIVLLTNNFA